MKRREASASSAGGAHAEDGSEEDDYMSEKFLKVEEEKMRTTVRRPGAAPPPQRQLPKKEAERKSLEEGLAKQLEQSNKGFQLLSKMGFRPGMGLGKDENGIMAPLTVQIKEDRSGLGKEEEEKRKLEEAMQMRVKLDAQTVDSFKAQQAARYKERHLFGKLREAKQIAYQLDVESGIKDSAYAPKEAEAEDEELEERGRGALRDRYPDRRTDEEEIPPSKLPELVGAVVGYLRQRHFYCLYCGIKYASIDALRARCPGETEEAHD